MEIANIDGIEVACAWFGRNNSALLVRCNGYALNEMQYVNGMSTDYPYICIDENGHGITIEQWVDAGLLVPTGERDMTTRQFILTPEFESYFPGLFS